MWPPFAPHVELVFVVSRNPLRCCNIMKYSRKLKEKQQSFFSMLSITVTEVLQLRLGPEVLSEMLAVGVVPLHVIR